MLAKQKPTAQISFYSTFEEQPNHSHPLYILVNRIDWNVLEDSFKNHCSATQGKPAKHIRLMLFLLILKQEQNLSHATHYKLYSVSAIDFAVFFKDTIGMLLKKMYISKTLFFQTLNKMKSRIFTLLPIALFH